MLPVAVLVVTVALTTAIPTTPEPPNGIPQCARSECPVYSVLEDYGSINHGIIKRRMEHAVWAYKAAPTCNISEAVGSVYMSLHSYFSDNNINRTTPIILGVQTNRNLSSNCSDFSDTFPCCNENYMVYFYVPRAFETSAPQPTEESGVQLMNNTMSLDFYVISLTGRATLHNTTLKYLQLFNYLETNDLCFWRDYYYIASYDAPWRPQPHLSEVLMLETFCQEEGNDRDSDEDSDEDRDGGDSHERREGNPGRRDQDRVGEGRRRPRREVDALSNVDLIPF